MWVVIAESAYFLDASESTEDEEGVISRPLWFEHKFDFGFPVELYPEIIERLRGTPARIEERLSDVPPALLTRRDGDKWSIQENIGHLLDLDELFAGRSLRDWNRSRPNTSTGRPSIRA